MRKKKPYLLICVAALMTCVPAACLGQEGRNTQACVPALDNGKVLELLRAGRTTGEMIEMIRRCPHRFDTSPDGLRALKAAGVSEDLIVVIVEAAGAPGCPACQQVESGTAEPDVGDTRGIPYEPDDRKKKEALRRVNRPIPVREGPSTGPVPPPSVPPTTPVGAAPAKTPTPLAVATQPVAATSPKTARRIRQRARKSKKRKRPLNLTRARKPRRVHRSPR